MRHPEAGAAMDTLLARVAEKDALVPRGRIAMRPYKCSKDDGCSAKGLAVFSTWFGSSAKGFRVFSTWFGCSVKGFRVFSAWFGSSAKGFRVLNKLRFSSPK